jgi:nicotinate-nucleotide adenylyltransferase
MQRIGVMGASFNPPTLGHASVIHQAYPDFDIILLVPSLLHAFQKRLAPIEHRLAMLNLLIDNELKATEKQRVRIDNLEPQLLQLHPERPFIYTFDVLSAIEERYQKEGSRVELQFIVGPDLATPSVWQRFYRFKEIEQRWPLYVVKEFVAIHSTMARAVKQQAELAELVGNSIATYIVEHHLYNDGESMND